MKKMSKQDVETVIFENAKTGEALEFQHEQHKAEYGAKHFGKQTKNSLNCFQRFRGRKQGGGIYPAKNAAHKE